MRVRRPWAVITVISGLFVASVAMSTFQNEYADEVFRSPASDRSSLREVKEGDAWYEEKIPTVTIIEQNPIGKIPSNVYDVRGVGDSGWTNPGGKGNRSGTAPPAGFGDAIKAMDPDGRMFRGHFNFINWESVVGTKCEAIRQQVDFYFLSRPDAVLEATERGYNLFGLANNHAQDCNSGKAFPGSTSKHGPLMTSESLKWVADHAKDTVLFNGAGAPDTEDDPYQAKVGVFEIDGKKVRIALGAIGFFTWNIPNAATAIYGPGAPETEKVDRLLKSLSEAEADLRILSIHTQDGSGSRREDGAFLFLKATSEKFIRQYNGDVVFGEGPHTWGGVRVFDKMNGKRGVVFTSLGNFVHQGLATNTDNYVARALFDRDQFDLREVQVYPFKNEKTSVDFYESYSGMKTPRANFEWTRIQGELKGKNVSGFSARFK